MKRDKLGWIVRSWTFLGAVVLALLLTQPMGSAADQPLGKGLITVNFQDTDLLVVIKFISELTGKNFVVDSKVKGRVTVISPTKITIEEAYRMFESFWKWPGTPLFLLAGSPKSFLPERLDRVASIR